VTAADGAVAATAAIGAPDLETLRFITDADVYKNGTLAGHLERTSEGTVTFSYWPDYAGDPVGYTLPVTPKPVERPGGALPSFFAGLLPEGHRLSVLRQATRTSLDDELTLLLAVGADAPGDVQTALSGTAPVEPEPLAAKDPTTLDFRALADVADRHALSGMKAKASASMLTTPLATAGRRIILKIDRLDHPYLVINESLYLEAAQALKIPVASAEVVHATASLGCSWTASIGSSLPRVRPSGWPWRTRPKCWTCSRSRSIRWTLNN